MSEIGGETIIGRWKGGRWTQERMEWRGGEGKVTQRLGDGRAGRDANWRHMENEGRREEIRRGITQKRTEAIDITIDITGPADPEGLTNPADVGHKLRVGTLGMPGTPTRGGVGGGRRKWRGGEYLRYCREMKIGMWEGVWRRAGEEILPKRGVG